MEEKYRRDSGRKEQMGRTPPWVEGILLRADGYETGFLQEGLIPKIQIHKMWDRILTRSA